MKCLIRYQPFFQEKKDGEGKAQKHHYNHDAVKPLVEKKEDGRYRAHVTRHITKNWGCGHPTSDQLLEVEGDPADIEELLTYPNIQKLKYDDANVLADEWESAENRGYSFAGLKEVRDALLDDEIQSAIAGSNAPDEIKNLLLKDVKTPTGLISMSESGLVLKISREEIDETGL